MRKQTIGVWTLAAALLAWTAAPALAGGLIKRPDLTIFSALAVGQSARAIGMGGAYTAAGNDVSAIWWNPAGLTGIERGEATFSHSQWFVNSTFNSGAAGFSRGVHTFAVAFMNFNPGDVEERTILRPQGTGRMLDLGTVAIGGAYARRFTDKLSFGVRLLWARENLDLTDFSTFNIDFGTLFYTGFKSVRLSMSMRNFGKDTEVLRREFQQPLTFNVGTAAEVYGEAGDPFYVTGSFEMTFAINYEERYHTGGEAWVLNMLALRTGYMANYDGFGFAAGGGVKVPLGEDRSFVADFAWQQAKNDLNAPMRISGGIRF